ncbi:ABC transporter permease [Dickeya fangzhongdai]|uniref:ABC transporter permease n=1 Tax=Dickeya fangzhongdai TaxID=1778540 RepID=UPI000EB0D64A|nr:ABC transporter permease [Dickeya fangzhongdai]AYH48411.1 ABC transporter permease [Dickeya fangzhongdai]ULR29394.1 ABC transporter permease [Dickeya fangzhongdai]UMB74992.1 ABC transporter permease [Dickeya fangzhongdai]
MARFILVRLLEALIAVWGVVTLVFFVTRVLGDPTVLLLPVGAGQAELDAMRHALGLDRPLYQQYAHTLWAMLHGDFGISFQYMQPAFDVVLRHMPATVTLALTALLFGVLLGAAAGAVAALMRGTLLELLVMVAALLGQATPVFWLGVMLILLFAVQLGWLPTGGAGGVRHVVLPAATLAVFVTASIARLLRSSMLDALREDYVRTARAKGLLPHTVFFWHVARNALIPVVTMVGIIAGELLGGSVVTETVFAWPGVGRLIVQAIQVHDFPVIQAGVVVVAVLFIVINVMVDMLYGVLDPRISRRR